MYGHVRSITDRQPVPMIEVSVQHDATVVEHTYTDTEGRYDLAGPAGLKLTSRVLQEVQLRLLQHFRASA